MTTPEIVKYILLGVFVLTALIGFLFGLGRGFSKALLRLVFFILFAGIAVVVTPYISNLVLDIPLNIGSLNGSVSEIIQNFINTNPVIESILSGSEVLQTFVDRLPITVVNLVVFVGLLFIFSGLSWIVFAIFAAIFGKKYKEPQKPKNVVVNSGTEPKPVTDSTLHVDFKTRVPKKLRFLGGIVGAVNGLIFLALLLTPVTGFLSMGTNLMMSTADNVVYASTAERTPTAQILDEYIPDEVKEYIQIYRESPIYYLSKYTGADSFVFDSLTTVKINVNNENFYISYRGELYSFARIYDDVEFVTKLDFENMVYEDLDYDKLEDAIDTVLSSKLIRTVAPELLNWVIDEVNLPVGERHIEINVDQQYVDMLNMVVEQYEANGGTYIGLTQDLDVVFDVFKAVGSSGIIDQAMSGEVNVDNIISLALANDREVINEVAGKIFDAISLRTILIHFLNQQLNEFTLSQDIANRVTFSEVSLPNVDWTNVSADFLSIVNKAVDIYESLDNSFTVNVVDLVQENPYELINADFNLITSKLGQIMTTIQEFDLFVDNYGHKVLYNQLMDYLNNMEFAEYVDFNEFKTANVWNSEMSNLNKIISSLKNSGIASVIVDNLENNAGMENLDINDLIDKLATYATNGNTYISNIVGSVLDSVVFRKALYIGFDYANDFIATNQSQLGADVVLGKIQEDAILDEDERVNILIFFDNVVLYAKDIDIQSIQSDALGAILESNLTRLGTALDSVKDSALFGPYSEDDIDYEGIYSALIHALANNTQFNAFADFEVALSEDFSWNTEMSLVQTAINEMNSIVINYDGVDKSLIKAIMDGEDLSTIIDVLTDDNVDNLVGPLVSSRLLGKNVVMLVNLMNQQVESILSTTIADIPSNTILANQTDDIKTIVKSILAIYPDIKDGLGATEIETLSSQLGDLLNAIKVNALRTDETGVFAGTYGAIINYLRSEPTFGGKITYILDEYVDQADVDWSDLLGLTVDVKDLGATSAIPTALKEKLSNILADMYQGEIYGEITTDVIDIVNMFINITTSSTEDDILTYVSNALQILAVSQNQYVLDNVGDEETLKLDFSDKVNTVIEFFEGLTGVQNFDELKNITDYQAEVNAINAIDTLLEVVNGEGVQIEDAEEFIEALVDSNLVMTMLEENGIVIDVDEVYQADLTTYIETEFAGNEDLINTLKTIFNLS